MFAARVVEIHDQLGITLKPFGRGDIFDPMLRPQPIFGAKCLKPAFGGNTCAGEDHDFAGVFGTGAEGLLGDDGTVDVPRLYDGTFPLADEIFSTTTVTLSGKPTTFEALSMMVHDPAILPDFRVGSGPAAAMVSIAVCTSPETVKDMTLETLEGYLGYFAWKVDGLAEMTIALPETGRAALELRVREFVDHVEVLDQSVILADGGVLTLTAPEPPAPGIAVWLAVAAFGFAAFAAFMIWPRASKPRTAT